MFFCPVPFLLFFGLIKEFHCITEIFDKSPIEICKSQEAFYVKIVNAGLDFSFYFYFLLFFFFFFLLFFYFQNNSGQGLSVTLSHQSQVEGVVTRLITGLERMKQKVLEQSNVIQHGQHMLASCYTHGCLGQGAQQLARTMGISIKGRLLCTRNSIEFSCVTQYKSCFLT